MCFEPIWIKSDIQILIIIELFYLSGSSLKSFVFFYWRHVILFTAKDLPRCPLGDNKCVCETGTVLLKKFAKGDPRINLVSIDPLHISKMTLKQGASSPVNIELNFKEVDLIGLSNHVFESIRFVAKTLVL